MAHEEMISGLINNLVDLALEEKDHASNNFLQWFVAEQVEEEATAGSVVDKLRFIKDDSVGIFALDLEMGKRAITAD